MREGKFREDLYYRINTVHIARPPLRERREDIVPLAECFVARYAEKYHRPVTGLDASARAALESGWWSGNIRELQNCIEKAVILSEGNALTGKELDFSTALRSGRNDNGESVIPGTSSVIPSEVEESRVREAMERTGGNISAAAKLLGVSRPTLYAKLKKYGL